MAGHGVRIKIMRPGIKTKAKQPMTIADIVQEKDRQELAEYRHYHLAEIEAQIRRHKQALSELLQEINYRELWRGQYTSFERYKFVKGKEVV
jgi:hypothetical protein